METGYDINNLLEQARNRWLKPSEVLFIIQNHQDNLISHHPPQKPNDGSLFLYNREILPCFRKDGHNWRKKKNTNRLAESHEQLKVDNNPALKCYYVRGEDNYNFQRRCYWMLHKTNKDIVLVHYRDTNEGNTEAASVSELSPRQSHTLSRSMNKLVIENQGNGSCQNLCSLGSLEVSPQMFAQRRCTDHLNDLDIAGSGSTSSNVNATQVLEGQPQCLDRHDDIQEPFFGLNNQDIFYMLGWDSSMNELDQTDSLQHYECYGRDDGMVSGSTDLQEIGMTACGSASNIQDYHTMLSAPSQCQMPHGTDSSMTIPQEHKFIIKEISPEWGFANETTKVIIIGTFLCNPSETSLACMFGDIEVPIQVIQDGVISCEAPPKSCGNVSVCVTSGNPNMCSESKDFEYRDRNSTCNNCTKHQQEKHNSIEEVELLVKLVQTLLSESSLQKGTFETASAAIDCVLQELLKHNLQQWLSSRSLSKKEQGIIHYVAGLGYEWALNLMLGFGVGVNFRDTNGWTALHWAARFGRENMVAKLIDSGASVRTFTNPTKQDPIGKTPAFIADANGHKGLAAYLSGLELSTHLSSLTFEEAHSVRVEPQLYISKIPMESVEGQSSFMKDALDASRNASEAAELIQAAFRLHSFKKRQLREASRVDEFGFTSDDLSVASKLMFPHSHHHNIAARTIQKHFRGWKRRKGYQTLRQKVVKIQAHVRGYRVRKYYRVIWAVGIMEKIILRWRRKGVGLRGYKPERENEEEEEDILKAFRKQRVYPTIREAVTRVQFMIHSPEARNQYTRMLDTFRKAKAKLVGVLNNEEELSSLADVFAMDNDNGDPFQLPLEAPPDSPGYSELWPQFAC